MPSSEDTKLGKGYCPYEPQEKGRDRPYSWFIYLKYAVKRSRNQQIG
ncbi:MAG: hypothetical protein HC879_08905 [Leptolyngbyaceae cyanobacterium SL_5_9]|nr:hypothetical protein [Leptolyngbyaceae cyanobacterium SL_5_9]NJO75939.1 hypothetical protein [Leptolyngbyaceae cyanobacterium RM1_406_9]